VTLVRCSALCGTGGPDGKTVKEVAGILKVHRTTIARGCCISTVAAASSLSPYQDGPIVLQKDPVFRRANDAPRFPYITLVTPI